MCFIRRHLRVVSWYSTRSSAAAPAGIIGKQCSRGSTRASTTHVRPEAIASVERLLELLLVLDGEAERAVRARERRVVGQRVREVDLREALLEEHVLPLAHHAEVAVVDDHDDDRQLLEHRGRELLRGHLEAAVAVDADDGRVRARGLRADRGRECRSPSSRARPR